MSEQPMSEPDSISSSVDVAVDPATAFKVFTEEVNCWWLQGPINFHDSTRAYEMRIEPRLEPLLRQARDDALTSDVSTQGRLNDLLAYKIQVESTPEWSFDSSTLLRFGLYLLIPVASMVGGALVERVVDMALD